MGPHKASQVSMPGQLPFLAHCWQSKVWLASGLCGLSLLSPALQLSVTSRLCCVIKWQADHGQPARRTSLRGTLLLAVLLLACYSTQAAAPPYGRQTAAGQAGTTVQQAPWPHAAGHIYTLPSMERHAMLLAVAVSPGSSPWPASQMWHFDKEPAPCCRAAGYDCSGSGRPLLWGCHCQCSLRTGAPVQVHHRAGSLVVSLQPECWRLLNPAMLPAVHTQPCCIDVWLCQYDRGLQHHTIGSQGRTAAAPLGYIKAGS